MASSTLMCFQLSHWRFRSRKAAPALRIRSATSRGVERHQQNAMVGSERRVDELRDFFLAKDRRKVRCSFRIGSLGNAPGLFESLNVEKPQRRETAINGARRQLSLLKQLSLVFANMPQAQAVPRT